MKRIILITLIFIAGITGAHAQGTGGSIYSFNEVLDQLFDQMLPLCSRLIDIGRAVGGFAALWYISIRVWKHIAAAEGIDFFPLLRPFAIGMAITLFPDVIGLMNGVLEPTVLATREISKDSHKAMEYHLLQREKQIKETPPETPYPGNDQDIEKYEQPAANGTDDGFFSGLKSAFNLLNIKNLVWVFISEIFHILYAAASLCINAIRTFYLLILAIIGPLVFGLSIFDGFQNTLSTWFARYIHVYMWLPVSNIFAAICSKILENMMMLDQNFASTTAYIVFLAIAIVGYTTVPNIAGYIIQPGGDNSTFLHKVNAATQAAGKALASKL